MKDNSTLSSALSQGVAYLGFVIDYRNSPRSITSEEFLRKVKWLRNHHGRNYKVVAVTVDMPLENMEYIIESGMADVIQLHGNEHISICRPIREQIETWKAINTKKPISDDEIIKWGKSVDKVLLDSGSAMEKAKNTSGAFENVNLYNSFVKHGIDVVLSGGLDINNVEHYLQTLNPSVIDVSRGIESAPGVKSKEKMMEFMKKVNHFYSDEKQHDEEE
jgi:phosphoribosylanthranilate isomerase